MKRPPFRSIIELFTATRLLLVMVTYFSYILLTAKKYSGSPVNIPDILSTWNQWDAANYVRIAQHGYQSIYDVAFFPLYPLLISGVAHLLGPWSYLLVATLISNFALLGAMFVLYQLAADIAGDHIASRALLYLCIFPTAFYFFAAYNESLFILLTAGSFLAMRRQRWWLAGLLGLLASLTRSAGVLLIFPYACEIWLSRGSLVADKQKFILRALPIVLIPLGTLLYAIYCWLALGNPLAFVTVQSHWGRHTTFPVVGIGLALYDLFWANGLGSFNEAHLILDMTATIAFIVLIVKGWKKLRASYNVWLAILMLFFLLSPGIDKTDPLLSNQRFVLELFPAFITLAILGEKHPRLHNAMLLTFPMLQVTMSILFIMGRWMV